MRSWLLLAALLAGPVSAQSAVASSGGMVTMMGGARPLSTVLDALGRQSGASVLVLPGVPDVQVSYQLAGVPFSVAWDAITGAHGLFWCAGGGVLAVGPAESVGRVCAGLPGGVMHPQRDSVAPAGDGGGPELTGSSLVGARLPVAQIAPLAQSPESPAVSGPRRHNVRIRLLEVADNASGTVGVDWSSGLLSTVIGAAAGAAAGVLPSFVPSDLSRTVSALESRGLARKLDDVRLVLTDGSPTVFRSGGSLQLSLVGGGDTKIERTLQYGLTLNLTPTPEVDGSLSVAVNADLSSPVSVSNPQLLDLTTRAVQSSVTAAPGRGVVLAAFASTRDEGTVSGLPGLSSVPGVSVLAGRTSSTAARTTVIVTLEMES